ncbi:MAG: S26 family signal peptidase [Thermoplasmata archaeon]|nr:S26 family signal peptidase [Thermoplasmata archaeon]
MAHPSSRRRGDDEDDPQEDDVGPPTSASRSGPSGRRRSSHRGVRPWAPGRAPEGDEPDDAEGEEGEPARRTGFFHREREPVYWRARDSLFFEPLVALAIIAVLLVGLFAYTQNWPPMYVVESESMQHGYVDQLGLINTGDLVLAQKINPTQVVPYMTGLQTGYQTYGEFGDVILYHPNGLPGTPIIHRAILYVYANPDGTYSVPGLNGLPCGSAAGAEYRTSTANGCGTANLGGTLTLLHIGWRSVTVSVSLDSVGSDSGFLTMGDNNFDPANPGQGIPDEPGLTSLVQPAWIVGVARGMLPWFGSVKLLLEGNADEVPPQSWQFLGLTIVLLVGVAFGLHYIARSAGRRGEESEEDGEDEEAGEEERPGRLRGLRLFRRGPSEEDDNPESEDSEDEPGPPVKSGRGRPRPSVKRVTKSKDHPTRDPDRRL